MIGSSKKQILQLTSPEDTWLSGYDDVSGTRGSGFESQSCQPFLTSPIVSSESESGGSAGTGDGYSSHASTASDSDEGHCGVMLFQDGASLLTDRDQQIRTGGLRQ